MRAAPRSTHHRRRSLQASTMRKSCCVCASSWSIYPFISMPWQPGGPGYPAGWEVWSSSPPPMGVHQPFVLPRHPRVVAEGGVVHPPHRPGGGWGAGGEAQAGLFLSCPWQEELEPEDEPGEHAFAYLDDTFVAASQARVHARLECRRRQPSRLERNRLGLRRSRPQHRGIVVLGVPLGSDAFVAWGTSRRTPRGLSLVEPKAGR